MASLPATGHSPEEIARAFERARGAQAQWRRYSLSQRVACLREFWEVLRGERERLAAVLREETGKPPAEVDGMELGAAELTLKYFTRSAHRVLREQAAPRPWVLFNKRAYVRYVPRGVVGLITPWNMPFLIPFADAVPAWLAGNAVVLKPSEWTPRTATFLAERFRASGLFPEGLLEVVLGGGEAGERVVEGSDMVLFTGSRETGRKVAAKAAERLTPVVLELGGKHPMIVARDASLPRAARAAVWGAFANCGQLCVGVERAFVERPAYPAFCGALERETSALRLKGEGYDVDLGRLIVPAQLDRFERHLEDARARGARVTGGEVLDRRGLKVSPALVLDAKPEMLVMREETFAPVLAVMAVDRVEDGVRLANAGPYGLAASVWTSDLSRGEEMAGWLEAGMVGVNDVLSHYLVSSLPFGGVKQSGLGWRLSEEGLRMFCSPQSVLVHEWPAAAPDPWWYPYSRKRSKLISLLTRWS